MKRKLRTSTGGDKNKINNRKLTESEREQKEQVKVSG